MGDRIAIWGAGRFGRYVYDQLKDRKDIDIRCFLDKDPGWQDKKIDGIEIYAPEQLRSGGGIIVDYVLISFLEGISIYNQLSEFKGVKFGVIKNRVFLEKLELKNDLMEDTNIFWVADSNKPLARTIETHVIDCCNLNCKGCSHFSNLYHADDMIHFDTYCRDLEQLCQNVNIFQFNMLGGEALLNERITDYLDFTRRVLPHADICLITNGLLIPVQKEDFFISCIENNIIIEISEYPPTLKMESRIISVLEQHGITYKVRKDINKFMKNMNLSGKADKYEGMRNCLQDGCNLLRDGKLYKCPFEALGNRFFEHFQLDIRLQGGADIYDKELDWKRLIDIYENEPVDACRYCVKGEWFPWEYSNTPTADDWIVSNEC